MDNLLGLVALLIVACVCWWAIAAILAVFNVGAQIATVVQVVFVLIVVVSIARQISGGGISWPWKKSE